MSIVDYSLIQWGAVVGASLVGALTDLRSRRIPNWLTLPCFGLGLAWSLSVRGPSGLLESLGAAILLGFPYVILWLYFGGGAGDAKMMAAIGAWLGIIHGAVALVAVAVAGALLGLGLALLRGRFLSTVKWIAGTIFTFVMSIVIAGARGVRGGQAVSPQDNMPPMPYGIAIFLGVCMAAAGVLLWRQ